MDSIFGVCESPIGNVVVGVTARGVSEVYFADGPVESDPCSDAILSACLSQIAEYFDGRRAAFSVPLDLAGTEFQLAVWRALMLIPCGQTSSYGAVAAAAGRPKAVRATGGANHRNPVSIIVPCHRVIGSDGSLTGYGGGLHRKRWLLDHEAKYFGGKSK